MAVMLARLRPALDPWVGRRLTPLSPATKKPLKRSGSRLRAVAHSSRRVSLTSMSVAPVAPDGSTWKSVG